MPIISEDMMKIIFLLATILLTIYQVTSSFLTFQVEPKATMCFHEYLKEDTPFELDFEVIRGGLLDIKFTLINPQHEIVEEKTAFFNRSEEELNDIEGRIRYDPKIGGEYQFCFDNTLSRWTPKVVAFQVRSERGNKSAAAKLQDLGPMVDSIIKMEQDLDAIEKQQMSARSKEKNYARTLSKVSSRLQWFVLFSSAILIGISLFSVLHIQKWFKDENQSTGV